MNVALVFPTGLRRLPGRLLPLALIALLGGAVGGCSGAHPSPASGDQTAASEHAIASPTSGATHHADAAWAARPDFVRTASAATQEAYQFAIARPDLVEWMPCYCGCGPIGHRSNLDCFVKPRGSDEPIVFEEHGSFCSVCVDIALKAKLMVSQGYTPLEIRMAIDAAFGNLAPGTPTELPPA